jgi:hypothetical protein
MEVILDSIISGYTIITRDREPILLSIHVIGRFTVHTSPIGIVFDQDQDDLDRCIPALNLFLARQPCSTLSNIKLRFRKARTSDFLNGKAAESRLGKDAIRGSSPTRL